MELELKEGICSGCHKKKKLLSNGLCIDCDNEKWAEDTVELVEAPPSEESLALSSKYLLEKILQLPPKHQRKLVIELISKDVAERTEIELDKIPTWTIKEAIESAIRWCEQYVCLKK